MFTSSKQLQYHAKPDKPDPLMARRIQEIIGGQWGEMTVMHQYLFQGWNIRGNSKFKDLILDTATEEIGHVELLATLVAQLLDDAPVDVQENAYQSGDPAVQAIMAGMNPQHAIVNGLGAAPKDSNGYPWSGAYITSSGNLLADMRYNITAESQGRLQVARLYHMTEDKGVRDSLGFLLARDTQHQLQWIAAAKELEEKEGMVVPHDIPESWEVPEANNVLYNFSEGEEAKAMFDGTTAPDGRKFRYDSSPKAMGEQPALKSAPPTIHNSEEHSPVKKVMNKGKEIIERNTDKL